MSLPPFYAQLLQNSLDCEGQSTITERGESANFSSSPLSAYSYYIWASVFWWAALLFSTGGGADIWDNINLDNTAECYEDLK